MLWGPCAVCERRARDLAPPLRVGCAWVVDRSAAALRCHLSLLEFGVASDDFCWGGYYSGARGLWARALWSVWVSLGDMSGSTGTVFVPVCGARFAAVGGDVGGLRLCCPLGVIRDFVTVSRVSSPLWEVHVFVHASGAWRVDGASVCVVESVCLEGFLGLLFCLVLG